MQNLTTIIVEKQNEKQMILDFEKALTNNDFKNLVSKLSVNNKELIKNRSSLLEASLEYKHCEGCKNLLACKNKISGYAYLPSVHHGRLSFNYTECKHKKRLEEIQKYQKYVYVYDVPKEIRLAQMTNVYKDDQSRFETIKYIIKFIREYQEGKILKGLYLHGNFGSGKTYLIAAAFNELAKSKVKSAIVFWPEYLRELKSSFGLDFEEKFEKVKRVALLLIDDIGAENMTTWARDEILCPLVQYRMSENLPTFFTSNLDLETLQKHLSMTKDKVDEVKARRIVERIKQLTVEQKMISKNLRT